MKLGLTILMTAMLTLTGCDDHLKEKVRKDLKDPDSAQFQNKIEKAQWACIEVNSKNSYGAYAGFKAVYLRNNMAMGWTVMDMSASSQCYLSTLDSFIADDNKVLGRVADAIELMRDKKLVPDTVKTVEDIPAGKCKDKAIEIQVVTELSLDRTTSDERWTYSKRTLDGLSDIENGSCEKRDYAAVLITGAPV